LCVVGLLLAACHTFLPTQGPTTSSVIDQAQQNGQRRFLIVKVNDGVIDTLLRQPGPSFHSLFGGYGLPPPPTLQVGDSVVVSIWEAAGGTLFYQPLTVDHALTLGSRGVSIPEQIVQPDGTISVPFAGRIHVVGRSPDAVAKLVTDQLNGKTVAPQVLVAVPRSPYYSVTVTGEVINGARVPLSPKGDRLLDMIAAAGGARAPVYQTFVRLTRHGVTGTIPLTTLISQPSENIYAWPGDVLTLVSIPRTFEAFGATGKNAQIPFDQEHLTVAQALGKSAGLIDQQADPNGVFLLRLEPKSVVEALNEPLPPASVNRPVVPVVYQFNLYDTRSYFLAQRFPVHDNDVIYVAGAESNPLEKLFVLLGTITGPATTFFYIKSLFP
jgi:polysaccharide biosynthesis/export protein